MKNGYSDITVVLDRSGSMACLVDEVIGAFNTFVDEQQQVAGTSELQDIFGPAERLAHSPDNLFHLAAQLVLRPGPRPALYQWCGTGDFLHADNVRFRDRAAALGLALTSEEGPGGHDWACWDAQIRRVLDWLPLPANR